MRDDWRPRGREQTRGLLKLLKQGAFRPVCGQEKTRQALSIDSDLGGTGLDGAEGFMMKKCRECAIPVIVEQLMEKDLNDTGE